MGPAARVFGSNSRVVGPRRARRGSASTRLIRVLEVERLVAHLRVGVIRTDANLRVLAAGERAIELLGLPVAALENSCLVDVLSNALQTGSTPIRDVLLGPNRDVRVWTTDGPDERKLRMTTLVGDGGLYVVIDDLTESIRERVAVRDLERELSAHRASLPDRSARLAHIRELIGLAHLEIEEGHEDEARDLLETALGLIQSSRSQLEALGELTESEPASGTAPGSGPSTA